MPPAPWQRAPALRPVPPTAGAPAPRLLYPALRSLLELLLRRNPCIRPEHRWHGETTDDAAILRTPAALAPHCAAPGSILLDLAANSSVSGESLRPHPENVLRPQSRHSVQVCVRRIYYPLSSWRCPDKRQSLSHILRSRKAAHRHRPCATPPGRRLWPSAVRRRN